MIRRDQLSRALCVIAIAVAILAIGGATRWAQAAVAAIVVSAVSSTVMSRRGFERWPPLLVLLLVAAGWTAIQLIPMPDGLVETLSPTLHGLREDGLALAGVHAPSTFSIDPSSTLRALAFLLTLSGIAVVALRLSVGERGRYALVACVGGLTGLTAIIAGIHELLGATALYGVYEPRQGVPPILGPLLNTNHLGCLMAVGAVTNLGLLLYTEAVRGSPRGLGRERHRVRRRHHRDVLAGRGDRARRGARGHARDPVRAADVGARGRGSRRRREKFLATTLPIGVVVTCGLVVAVYLGAGTVMQQLEGTTLQEFHSPKSKFEAWRNSAELVEESPWVGVGRGAFESAFTRVHPASAFYTFSHPENEAVQAVTEWGVPATLVLAALTIWMMLLGVRRWKDGPLAAGALGALMVVAFQSNFDFGMELLGLAAPVVVLVATLTYVPLAEQPAGRLRRLQLVRLGHVLAILAGGLLLLTGATRTLDDDHATLKDHPTRTAIEAVIEAHPLDYYAYASLAEQLGRANDPNAVRVLNHALRLHPTHPGLHWIAARLLVRSGRLSQAESEYAMSVRYSLQPRPVIAELVGKLPADRAARAIPVELYLDGTVRTLRELGHADVAMQWADRVLILTNDPRAAEALYTVAMAQKDFVAAERAARSRCRDATPRCQLDLARVLALQGKRDEVIATLKDVVAWHGRPDDRLAAWLMLCDTRAALGNLGDAQDCLRRLDISGLVEPDNRDVQRRREAYTRVPRPAPGQPGH